MFSVQPHRPRSLNWWYRQRRDIDFDASYQRRGAIWSVADKAYLIDTLLNQYDIPKIYIADFTICASPLNVNRKFYALVSGAQYFEAVFDFFDGAFSLADDFLLYQNQSLSLGGLCYAELMSRYQSVCTVLDDYEPTVMSVIATEEFRFAALFARLRKHAEIEAAKGEVRFP